MDVIAQLLAAAGAPDGERISLAGGDVGEVVRVGEVVVKVGTLGPEAVAAEARGLGALSTAVRTPEVVHCEPTGLVLAYLRPAPLVPEEVGRAIAALHQVAEDRNGSSHPVFLGRWRMPAGQGEDDWVARRMLPILEATASQLGLALTGRVARVLRECQPPIEGPRRLHGDLWSGNVLGTALGPAFIDPAQFAGERAADLAMMGLFGGFDGRCMAAYEESLPIPGEVRRHLDYYVLLYLLVHVWMFGAGYVGATESRVRRLGF